MGKLKKGKPVRNKASKNKKKFFKKKTVDGSGKPVDPGASDPGAGTRSHLVSFLSKKPVKAGVPDQVITIVGNEIVAGDPNPAGAAPLRGGFAVAASHPPKFDQPKDRVLRNETTHNG